MRLGGVAVRAAAVTASVAMLVACGGGGGEQQGTSSPRHRATLPSATATLSSSAASKHGPVADVRTLLAARAKALLGADRPGFVGAIDDSATALQTEQRAFYDNIRGASLASWTYTIDPKSAHRHDTQGAESWDYVVYTTYSFAGLPGQHAVVSHQVDVVERTDGWRIASITPKDTHPEPWDLGTTLSVRSGRVVVVGVDRSRAELERIRDQAAAAIPRVEDVWRDDWARGAVVVVPPDTAGAGELTGSENIDALAAVATGGSAVDASGEMQRWERVVVNPKAWQKMDSTGRQVVLAHELTHVATGSLGSVPIWVSEGLADYVGWKDSGLSTRRIAQELGAEVRRGDLPDDLPVEADFHGERVDQAYEASWLAARYIAFRYGEDKLLAVYRGMAEQSSTGKADQDRVFRSTLKVSRSAFLHGWRSYLQSRLH